MPFLSRLRRPGTRKAGAVALTVAVAALMAACGGDHPDSIFHQRTEFNREVDFLFKILIYAGTAVFIFVEAILVWTLIKYRARPGQAVCDAGLKVLSLDSGLPVVHGRDDVGYVNASDEHGVIEDRHGVLRINEKLKLVPGHCDPTCNLHDWYVGVRNGKVEVVWPVSARGKSY